MLRISMVAISLILASPSFAKDITITLNDQEQKVFLALIDQALKSGGLSNLNAANQFLAKIQAAQMPSPEAPKK